MTPPPPEDDPPSTPRRSRRREEILGTARTLFATHGYAMTTMRDLSSATGLLPGSLYAHFPSKADIVPQILTEFFEELLPAQRAVAESDDVGVVRLARMLEVVYPICERHHETLRILHSGWDALVVLDELEDVLAGADETLRLWQDAVVTAIDDQTLDSDFAPQFMVRVIVISLHGLLDRSRFTDQEMTPAIDVADLLVRMFASGPATEKGREALRNAPDRPPLS